jgi:hypothetical protein
VADSACPLAAVGGKERVGECGDALGKRRIFVVRHDEVHGEDVSRIEAERRASQMRQVRDEEEGAREEDEGEHHLGHDEQAPCATTAGRDVEACANSAEQRHEPGACAAPRRRDAEETSR